MLTRLAGRWFSSIALLLLAAGCGPPSTIGVPVDRSLPVLAPIADLAQFYREIGLIVAPPPMSLVGKVSYFATRSPDTTLVLVSFSLPNRGLTFSREGDSYRAPYEAHIRLLQNNVEAGKVDALEVVRVGSFKEINRSDESVIFQHFFRVPAGAYSLSLNVRDIGGSRQTTQEAALQVPKLPAGAFSSPIVVYNPGMRMSLDSVPRILASPRSSAVFGRDSTVAVFLEAYGNGATLPVTYIVRNDQGATVLTDSTVLMRHGDLFSGTVAVPISNVGLGIARLAFARRDFSDTTAVPIFVSFGEDIPVMSFENMIQYLRFYAPPYRLNALRQAPPAKRAAVWAAFLRDTDPVPDTPVNEDLQSYFAHIEQANTQFKNDHTPGWLSDRGMVFVALGEPNQIIDRNVSSAVSRTQIGETAQVQIWDYPQYQSQIVFYQDAGRWRLTRSSENEFWQLTSRKLSTH
jgi:GWxTD domain-containing protein